MLMSSHFHSWICLCWLHNNSEWIHTEHVFGVFSSLTHIYTRELLTAARVFTLVPLSAALGNSCKCLSEHRLTSSCWDMAISCFILASGLKPVTFCSRAPPPQHGVFVCVCVCLCDLRKRSLVHFGTAVWGRLPVSGHAPHPRTRCRTWSHSAWWSGHGHRCRTPNSPSDGGRTREDSGG